jgi:1-deoxy-D-xylulose-5-phosphate synthase
MALVAQAAAERLAADGVDAIAVNARFLKPMDEAMLTTLVRDCRLLVTVEEGTIVNGFGAMLARRLQETHPEVRVLSLGIADELMVQASRADQLAQQGLTPDGIVARVKSILSAPVVR